jgi:hypothetical protein
MRLHSERGDKFQISPLTQGALFCHHVHSEIVMDKMCLFLEESARKPTGTIDSQVRL